MFLLQTVVVKTSLTGVPNGDDADNDATNRIREIQVNPAATVNSIFAARHSTVLDGVGSTQQLSIATCHATPWGNPEQVCDKRYIHINLFSFPMTSSGELFQMRMRKHAYGHMHMEYSRSDIVRSKLPEIVTIINKTVKQHRDFSKPHHTFSIIMYR